MIHCCLVILHRDGLRRHLLARKEPRQPKVMTMMEGGRGKKERGRRAKEKRRRSN